MLPQWLIHGVWKEGNGSATGGMVKLRSQSDKDAIRTWIILPTFFTTPSSSSMDAAVQPLLTLVLLQLLNE